VTIHYHGTPITGGGEADGPPNQIMVEQMTGAHFCVSHWRPTQVRLCHEIGQSVMLDNGAFSAWEAGVAIEDWTPFYDFADRWLDCPTTWAVIPDVITGTDEDQDGLLGAWPHGSERAAPVWHMHEKIDRLLRLVDQYPRVCIGSSAQFAEVLSPSWERRMDAAWREIVARHRRTPNVHMLRGMQLVRGQRWPFASVDSTDIARNHSAKHNKAAKMRRSWDCAQCPSRFCDVGEQLELVA
jgi:hypothetical protein